MFALIQLRLYNTGRAVVISFRIKEKQCATSQKKTHDDIMERTAAVCDQVATLDYSRHYQLPCHGPRGLSSSIDRSISGRNVRTYVRSCSPGPSSSFPPHGASRFLNAFFKKKNRERDFSGRRSVWPRAEHVVGAQTRTGHGHPTNERRILW